MKRILIEEMIHVSCHFVDEPESHRITEPGLWLAIISKPNRIYERQNR